MKHRSPKVLYFSISESKSNRSDDFWRWIQYGTANSHTYQKNFLFYREDVPSQLHAADLALFLERCNDDLQSFNLQSFHIIIDIESIPDNQIDVINNLIIQYPEIQFLFDKRKGQEAEGTFDLLSKLFPDKVLEDDIKNRDDKQDVRDRWNNVRRSINVESVLISWEKPDVSNEDFIQRIIAGRDNTFDASNLRYAIKYRKYISLKVDHNRNFSKLQDSRRDRLAICVEEETRQNIVNSYGMYANGYRVLPISTRQELKIVNNNRVGENSIIIRDYDLQFEDEKGQSVDEIRGYKYCSENDLDIIKREKGSRTAKKYYKLFWNDFTAKYEGDDNLYWSNLKNYPIYFVTKGPNNSEIKHPSELSKVAFDVNNEGLATRMNLPGFSKPVCGIYSPFQGITKPVEETYLSTRYKEDSEGYKIETSRAGHDHSTPLDIYEMVNSMIRRAETYYDNKRYLLAALVAGESIELLNGFHHRLMVKAYFIQSKAENAIAMDVVGGNEKYLAKDAAFRVNKIKEDIKRFYSDYAEKSSRNVLNQIFSTCRQFCKENEHFDSEEVFLSAIGHLNEGFPFSRIVHSFVNLHERFQNIHERYLVRCEEELLVILNNLSEQIQKIQPTLFLGDEEILIRDLKGHYLLKRYRRQYKKLSGQKWPYYHSNEVVINPNTGLESDTETSAIRVPQVILVPGKEVKLGLKLKFTSFFKRTKWLSLNGNIASFKGNTLITHQPGTTLIIAKTGNNELKICIVVKE